MPVVYKVTETLFDQIKDELKHVSPLISAQSNHLSMKTILMVKGSETYSDYEAQKKAQHPPTKFSMRDMLVDINAKLDRLINLMSEQQGRLF